MTELMIAAWAFVIGMYVGMLLMAIRVDRDNAAEERKQEDRGNE